MAIAGEPGNYQQPDYVPFHRQAPGYEHGHKFYRRPPGAYHRSHKKFYEEFNETYIPPQPPFYGGCGNCAPAVLPYPPGPAPLPTPYPGQYPGQYPAPYGAGVCVMYPAGPNVYSVVLNGQAVLYTGYAPNAAQMFAYYQSRGICHN